MQFGKLLVPAAALGLLGGSWMAAQAEEPAAAPNVQALIQRLEAAEKEIATLKGQLAAPPTQTTLYSPGQLGTVAPAAVNGPLAPELADRVADIEKKIKAQEEAEAKKRSEFPTYKLMGRVHADSVWASQDADNRAAVGDIEDGSDFRRARIGLEGALFENSDYRMEIDFAGSGRPSFADVYTTIKELPCIGNIRIGHFKEPFSLEELTSARFITFLERGLPNTFAPARNMGVSAFNYSEDETMTWATGWFRTGSDEFGDDVGDEGEQSFTSRITLNPYYDEGSGGRYLVHLGGAYSYRDADEGTVSFGSTPEVRMRTSGTGIGGSGEGSLPNFVATGGIPAEDYQLFGLEAAVVWGSLSVQSEYIAAVVDRTADSSVTFDGFYVYASYFLTGEHRVYNRKTGAFDRVKPLENFFSVCTEDRGICTGWGAWELKARWSYLNLADGDFTAADEGRLSDITLGVNWYLNPNFRIMFDYIHAELDDNTDESDADIVAMRASFDW